MQAVRLILDDDSDGAWYWQWEVWDDGEMYYVAAQYETGDPIDGNAPTMDEAFRTARCALAQVNR
mgnify:CR=1 FL=1